VSRTATDPELSGSILAGRYLLTQRIGRGGMGVVYRASDLQEGGEVAIKVLSHERAGNRRHGDRFTREIEALQRVDHPNTVKIFGSGTNERGDLWFAMELVRGTTLNRHAKGPLAVPEIEAIIRQILHALDAVHQAGLIHRDLKPSNIMIETTPGGPRVKVLDFGVVRFTDPDRSVLTAQNTLLGTPAYIAPELIRGQTVDARADLYAVGVVLHTLATGAPPFSGPDNNAVLRAHLRAEIPSVEGARPDDPLPERLEALRVALLAKDPALRPQTAERALAILDGEAPLPKPPRGPSRVVLVAAAVASGVVLGIAALALIVAWLW